MKPLYKFCSVWDGDPRNSFLLPSGDFMGVYECFIILFLITSSYKSIYEKIRQQVRKSTGFKSKMKNSDKFVHVWACLGKPRVTSVFMGTFVVSITFHYFVQKFDQTVKQFLKYSNLKTRANRICHTSHWRH